MSERLEKCYTLTYIHIYDDCIIYDMNGMAKQTYTHNDTQWQNVLHLISSSRNAQRFYLFSSRSRHDSFLLRRWQQEISLKNYINIFPSSSHDIVMRMTIWGKSKLEVVSHSPCRSLTPHEKCLSRSIAGLVLSRSPSMQEVYGRWNLSQGLNHESREEGRWLTRTHSSYEFPHPHSVRHIYSPLFRLNSLEKRQDMKGLKSHVHVLHHVSPFSFLVL